MFGMMEAMLSFLRRQIGLRTDAADPAGSLHAKTKDTNNKVTSIINQGSQNKQAIASNTVRLSADTVRSTSSTSYVLVKKIFVYTAGIYRVSFDLRAASGYTAYGRVYCNGVAYGTERSTTSTSYVTFTEDLFFRKIDSVELYIKTSSDGSAYAQNFRISFDYATTLADGYVAIN